MVSKFELFSYWHCMEEQSKYKWRCSLIRAIKTLKYIFSTICLYMGVAYKSCVVSIKLQTNCTMVHLKKGIVFSDRRGQSSLQQILYRILAQVRNSRPSVTSGKALYQTLPPVEVLHSGVPAVEGCLFYHDIHLQCYPPLKLWYPCLLQV